MKDVCLRRYEPTKSVCFCRYECSKIFFFAYACMNSQEVKMHIGIIRPKWEDVQVRGIEEKCWLIQVGVYIKCLLIHASIREVNLNRYDEFLEYVASSSFCTVLKNLIGIIHAWFTIYR